MKGYKYTIKVVNFATDDAYVEFQIYSNEYNPKYYEMLLERCTQLEKEIIEAEMPYTVAINSKTEPDAEFRTYTYTIH